MDPLQPRLEGCERRAEMILLYIKQLRDYIRSLEEQLRRAQGGT